MHIVHRYCRTRTPTAEYVRLKGTNIRLQTIGVLPESIEKSRDMLQVVTERICCLTLSLCITDTSSLSDRQYRTGAQFRLSTL
jgi:hypothetical protein